MQKLSTKVHWPASGCYLIAVSGGVDSMSLLHLLLSHGGYELIVAHYDHGLRLNSGDDRRLVQRFCKVTPCKFVYTEGKLAKGSSQATARTRRYDWLIAAGKKYQATAIVTAHHLDDRLETMLLNERRGANWYGLAPLCETNDIKRPLLKISKPELYNYARAKKLPWREDPTNFDASYTLRNAIRQQLPADKTVLVKQLRQYDAAKHRKQAQQHAVHRRLIISSGEGLAIMRSVLLSLNAATARDALYLLLKRRQAELEIDRDCIYRLEHFCKTATRGKCLPLSGRLRAIAGKCTINIVAI